jgi:multidrug efflux system membrane fusion protein
VRKVTLGPSDGQNTVVASGLNAGDTVITDGTDRLSDGAKIKVAAAPAQQVSRASPPAKKTDGSDAPSPDR